MSSTTPPGGPEYLESSAGSPVERTGSSTDRRKRFIALGGLVGVLALGGGAAWAATSFLATGDQPSEALPASTLGYISIDLDPSGDQKIEAIQTLRKFPAFKEQVGLETDDDLREKFFEEIVKSGECKDLDFAKDVEPWLGNRAAVGAADLGGDTPTVFGVVQVKDADKATEGLDNLRDVCSDGSADASGGWVAEGDWVVIAETEADAQKVVDATDKGSLADDADFQKWTGEAGDAGIVSMYAAPEAGKYLGSQLSDMSGMGSLFGMGAPGDLSLVDPATGELAEPAPAESPSIPPEIKQALDEFNGAAATMRFNDGSFEVEFAGDAGDSSANLFGSSAGVDGVENLPDDTLAAVGIGFGEGWFESMVDRMAAPSGLSPEELLASLSEESGLNLPADADTLLGEALTLSLGGDFNAETAVNGGPEDIPAGLTIKGDPEKIEAVLDKIRPQLGEEASLLETEDGEDSVTISPKADYRASLAKGGNLGDTEAYKAVVDGADDASAVLFVNFDAGDNWLATLAGDDQEAVDNIEPLSAFGIAAWRDGDVSHSLLRLTTD